MLLLMTVGCGQAEVADVPLIEAGADSPGVVEVVYGDVYDSDRYEAQAGPYMKVLQFAGEGKFEEYKVSLGDEVTTGQVLATTVNEYADEIKELKKEIALMETEYNNAVTNYDLQLATNEWRVGELRVRVEGMDEDDPGFDAACISFEMMMADGERIELNREQYIERSELELSYKKERLEKLTEKSEGNIITAPCNGVVT